MELIFKILCGMLYVIGIPFGWSYQTTSVIICIYLVPSICTLFTLPILYQCVKQRTFFGTLLSLIYTLICVRITLRYIHNYPIGNEGITEGSFNTCMEQLENIAQLFGISYIEVNLFIYVVLFAAIVGFNLLIAYLIKKYGKK